MKRWIDEAGHLVVYLYLPEWVASLRTRSPIPSDWTSLARAAGDVAGHRGARAVGAGGSASRSCATPWASCPSCPCATARASAGSGRSEIEPVTSNQDAINYFRAMTVVGARFLAYPQRVLLNVVPEVDPTTGLAEEALQGAACSRSG